MASLGTRLIVIFSALCLALPLLGQQLCEGDLLFCCSESPNAITDVTSGANGLLIDHVAVVHRIGGDDGLLYVIEAKKPVVCLTSIDDFGVRTPRCCRAG